MVPFVRLLFTSPFTPQTQYLIVSTASVFVSIKQVNTRSQSLSKFDTSLHYVIGDFHFDVALAKQPDWNRGRRLKTTRSDYSLRFYVLIHSQILYCCNSFLVY